MMTELSNQCKQHLTLIFLLLCLQSLPFVVFGIETQSILLESNSSDAQVMAELPPAYGYSVGDVIQHRYHITLEDGAELNTDRLPAEGSLRDWLEVNVLEVEQLGQQIIINIEYQLFKGLKQTEQLSIPPIALTIKGANSSNPLIIPAWRFSAGPLIPSNISDQDIQAQDLITPKRQAIQPGLQGLFAALVIAVLAALYIVWRQGTVSFIKREANSFGTATQHLKQLPKATAEVAHLQNAFRHVHNAFDTTAGTTVLAVGLDDFFQHRTILQSLRPQTENFFTQSRQLFFEQADKQLSVSIADLIKLCEQYDRLLRRR